MSLNDSSYDAVVVGSGPNGLAAGIRLSLEGFSVKIIEASDTIGGGMRTKELIEPGYYHDVCSAIHPMAVSSPFLKKLPLEKHGLKWIHPIHPVAHPLDGEPAVILFDSLAETAFHLQEDDSFYRSTVEPLKRNWDALTRDFLGPLRIPANPIQMALFGLKALQSANRFQKNFKTLRGKALLAGMAAHSILPLDAAATAAIALVFFGTAHTNGWPLPKRGSQSIAEALSSLFTSLGGEIETGFRVKTLADLPKSKAVLFDLTPQQVSRIVGDRFPPSYKRKLRNFKQGSGVFKIDYILYEPVPWSDPECRRAGTVHLGGTYEEIAASEKDVAEGRHPKNPFVLVAQQSLFDETRTPNNKETLWAYCHVPNGSNRDMTTHIEQQIERFAPGFKDIIEAKTTMNTSDFEEYNPNYIGGDINGGRQDITQLFSRPVHFYQPYATPGDRIYFCSASTPPGGGVHGMCGYHAANLVLKKEFGRSESDWKFRI